LLLRTGAKKPKGDLMKHYETMLVLKPTLTDEEKDAIIENVKKVITDFGGEVAAVDNIGIRELAYPIQKFERGHYYIVYYKAPAPAVVELERQLRYNEDVLRFMSVKYETKKDIARWEKMVADVQ
jgi:small subunit ribosomal protein S6